MKALLTFSFVAMATLASAQQIDSTTKPGTIYIIDACHGLVSNLKWLTPIEHLKGLESGVFTSEILQTLPMLNTADIVALAPRVYQRKRGDDVNIAGARTEGTLYVIDGMRIAW